MECDALSRTSVAQRVTAFTPSALRDSPHQAGQGADNPRCCRQLASHWGPLVQARRDARSIDPVVSGPEGLGEDLCHLSEGSAEVHDATIRTAGPTDISTPLLHCSGPSARNYVVPMAAPGSVLGRPELLKGRQGDDEGQREVVDAGLTPPPLAGANDSRSSQVDSCLNGAVQACLDAALVRATTSLCLGRSALETVAEDSLTRECISRASGRSPK